MTFRQGSGFTLIEVVVGLVILTLSATGVMYISTLSSSGNTRSKDYSAAMVLALERIEDLKNRGYDALPSTNERKNDGTFTSSGGSGGIYTRQYEVSNPFPVAASPGRVVTVYVSWTNGGSVTLTTLIVKPTTPIQGGSVVSIRSWNQVR